MRGARVILMSRRILSLLLLLGAAGCNCSSAATSGLTAELSITCVAMPDASSPQCVDIDFGNVQVGGSAERKLALSNHGRGRLIVSDSGWAPQSPALIGTTLGAELTGGGAATITLTFAPQAVGAVDSVWFVASNAKGKPRVEIRIHGVGVGPAQAQVSPNSIDFGNVTVNTTANKTITVQNNDTVPIEVTAATLTAGASVFAVTLPTDASIQPGATLELTAGFTPTEAGTWTGSAEIRVIRFDTPSATPATFPVALAGRSLPIIEVDPTSLVFGNHTQGSHTQGTVTIKNVGVAPLLVQTIALSADTSATYTLVSPVPSGVTLAPNDSVVTSVAYAPVQATTVMVDTGAILIGSSDPATPMVTVPITGQCTNCVGPPPNSCSMARTCDCGVQSTCAAGGSCVPARRVFVAKTMTNGNLGGTSGADQLCNRYATDAVLGGTWKAFVADSTSAPASRFTTAAVPYALLDGTLVANDWSGFTSGSLLHGISTDECGGDIGNAEVWTGLSSPSATSGSSQCNDFQSGSSSASYAYVGLTSGTSYSWYNVYLQYCDRTNVRLYCVEQ
jgi:hypothetical protein